MARWRLAWTLRREGLNSMLIFDAKTFLFVHTVLRTLYHVRSTLRSLYGMRHMRVLVTVFKRTTTQKSGFCFTDQSEVNVRCRKSASLPTNRNTQFSLSTDCLGTKPHSVRREAQKTNVDSTFILTSQPWNLPNFGFSHRCVDYDQVRRSMEIMCHVLHTSRFQTLVLRTHHDQSPYTETTECTLPSSVA